MRQLGIGQRQRRHSIRLLSADAERFPAARENRQQRALPQQRIGQLRSAMEQVLAVIEQQN